MAVRISPWTQGLDSTATGPAPAATPGPATEPDGAVLGTDSTTPSDHPPDDSLERRGQLVGGRYRIGGLLGKGGMGAVYEAEQLDLGRVVAVKMLRAEGSGSEKTELIGRFEREARLAAAIGHPNIINVYDVGRTEKGEPFMVMERLHGGSLESLLSSGEPMPLGRLVSLLDQVLAALAAAHAKGVVHRDIKPENIFVCPPADGSGPLSTALGSNERVKVLDFGVSKMLQPVAGLEKLRLTRTGTLLGTPLYMSPEQAAGESTLDLRVDIYAVGVIAYRALSGRYPYLASNFNALMAALLTKQAASLAELVPGLHPAWGALVGRAMARERGERFQSADEMRAALRALPLAALQGTTVPPGPVAGAPLSPHGPGSQPEGVSVRPRRAESTLRRRRPGLLMGAVLGVGLAVASAAYLGIRGVRVDAGPTTVAPAVTAAPAADAGGIPAALADVVAAAAPLAPPAPADAGPAAVAPDASAPAAPAAEVIRVRLTVKPETATVTLDDRSYTGSIDTVLPKDPTARLEIAVSAPGHRERRILRDRGKDLTDTVTLQPLGRPSRRPSSRVRTVLE
jgi:serine/threonine-protein kinase